MNPRQGSATSRSSRPDSVARRALRSVLFEREQCAQHRPYAPVAGLGDGPAAFAGVLFELVVGVEVDLDRFGALVPEPQRDRVDIDLVTRSVAQVDSDGDGDRDV